MGPHTQDARRASAGMSPRGRGAARIRLRVLLAAVLLLGGAPVASALPSSPMGLLPGSAPGLPTAGDGDTGWFPQPGAQSTGCAGVLAAAGPIAGQGPGAVLGAATDTAWAVVSLRVWDAVNRPLRDTRVFTHPVLDYVDACHAQVKRDGNAAAAYALDVSYRIVDGVVAPVAGLVSWGYREGSAAAAWGLREAEAAAAWGRDPDGDGHDTATEAVNHADPVDPGSRPDSDDDGDGIANRHEKSRAHALGLLPDGVVVRAGPADRLFVHLQPGAAVALFAPDTHAWMVVGFVPHWFGQCLNHPLTLPPRLPCLTSLVAEVALDGRVVGVRRVDGGAAGTLAGEVQVACGNGRNLRCLDGVVVDGTWRIVPPLNQWGEPAGVRLTVANRTFDDVAPGSGDIVTGGSGQASRNRAMHVRTWNWHLQDVPVHRACDKDPVWCLVVPREESVREVRAWG